MSKLTDGLTPPIDGKEERLDRVLMGLELLLGRAGVSIPDASVEPVQPEQPVTLREPAVRRYKKRGR